MSYTVHQGPTTRTVFERLTESERYRLRSDARRRVAFEVLVRSDAPVELDELAAAVAKREAGGETDDPATEDTAIALHHVHLPMFDSLDLVDYDPDASRVESCPDPTGP